jgi:hypothetical protein
LSKTGCNNTQNIQTMYDNNIPDAWITTRCKQRGRTPFNNGGRGLPRGRSRNGSDPVAAPTTTRAGSSIVSTTQYKNSTSNDTNDTLNDTIKLFILITPTIHLAPHIVTVSPKHAIKQMWRPHTPNLILSSEKFIHNLHPCFPLCVVVVIENNYRYIRLSQPSLE